MTTVARAVGVALWTLVLRSWQRAGSPERLTAASGTLGRLDAPGRLQVEF